MRLIRDAYLILSAKGARTLASGMVSVLTPIYLAKLGYPPLYVSMGVFLMIMGNVVSNMLLTWYGNVIGKRRLLIMLSVLMVISGFILMITDSIPLLALALLVGNISTTGTETGPFQSVEVGVAPRLIGDKVGEFLGLYNLIGYSASSLGALMTSLPSYFNGSIQVMRLMFITYAAAGLIMLIIYLRLKAIDADYGGTRKVKLSKGAVDDIRRLTILFSVDAFGGGLVSQSLLSYWFYLRYGVSLRGLGVVFMVVNVITALSLVLAPLLARRIGTLNTMVFTHLASNIFLILIPISSTFIGSLAFLLLRQSLSQMDVPTRQTLMAHIFNNDHERITANAITNTARSISSLPGSPIVGLALSMGLFQLPFILSGVMKIMYDASIFILYKDREH
ncbi:MFS transporter [Caldivirga sp.]|uniref:MFS transporter n=1 Tax=Caldivirga sp. TaxID=2080243 RepID=UPI003D0C4806